jgi:hypothetical protein
MRRHLCPHTLPLTRPRLLARDGAFSWVLCVLQSLAIHAQIQPSPTGRSYRRLRLRDPTELPPVICSGVMGVIFLKRIRHEARGSLGPDEIRIAVTAYEAALKLIGGAAGDDGVRDTLASHIIQNVLDGGRDEVAVRESAIGALTGMKRRA